MISLSRATFFVSACANFNRNQLLFMTTQTSDSAQSLQAQFAGGRDIWHKVPLTDETGATRTKNIQNRVQQPDETDATSDWPAIVKESILYGLTAYNPMGQIETDEYNRKHYQLLKQDIIAQLIDPPRYKIGVVFWEAASIFPNGSSEPGFIVALNKTLLNNKQLLDDGKQTNRTRSRR